MTDANENPGNGPAIEPLLHLVARRWSIPVLARLHGAGGGARFVMLARALGVSRASLSATLNHLIALGLVRRNTGHGHPMRPEYLLTDAGTALARHCAALDHTVARNGGPDLAYRKWTLPLVTAIGDEHVRFRDLRARLAEATPRAITIGLKQMVEERWVDRSLIDDYPPAAGYHLLPRGERVWSRLQPFC
ncbi:winged helix-turn-helix transcriptional regulator [Lentisalinibacter sediminis]|uniref:winged helix-turn-helix transcriptional regulator n=1 Tax=Lentisalinibacter sediminis TaxID=2992237 RepID=UPI00386BC179